MSPALVTQEIPLAAPVTPPVRPLPPGPPPNADAPPGGGGRGRGRRFAIMLTGVATVLLLVAGVWFGVGSLLAKDEPDRRLGALTSNQGPGVVPPTVASASPSAGAQLPEPSPSGDTGTTADAAWAAKVKLGVFRGTSRSEVSQFASWLGRDVDYVVDFSTRQTWDQIADPDDMIRQWAPSTYRVVYSTGMLPISGGSTMAAGARGSYDSRFRTLAKNLVDAGQDDAIIRLGWEFNLESSRWSTDRPADFIAYWRHVVTAMRSVPGQHFEFDWNPNVGDNEYDATLYYPGTAYVDYIGVDVYDLSWQADTYPYPASCSASCRLTRQQAAWDRIYNGFHGLGFWSAYAQSKGKPMSLPEWGVWNRTDQHGGGDNPYFVEQMYRFIASPANNVAYQAYFETNTSKGQHRLMTSNPQAGKMYRQLFGG